MRAVLWDLDGTLVDSAEYHWRSWQETMAAEEKPVTHQQFLDTFGQRNDAIIPLWIGPECTPEDVVRIGDEKEVRYRRLIRQGRLEPLPGAAEWVRRLKDQGWLQAVASSAPRLNIEVVLEVLGMDQLFQTTVSAEDVQHGKPAPDVFVTAASRLGVPPGRCIVVEDAPAGVEAARRAGMISIGVNRNGSLAAASLTAVSLDSLPDDAFNHLLG